MRLVLVATIAAVFALACSTGHPLDIERSMPAPSPAVHVVTPTPEPTTNATPSPEATATVETPDPQMQVAGEDGAAEEPTSVAALEPTTTATPAAAVEPLATPAPTAVAPPPPLATATPVPDGPDRAPIEATPATSPSFTSPRAALPGAQPELRTLPVPAGSYLDGATVVSLYGHPDVCTMGELGCHSPDRAVGAVQAMAVRYDALNGDKGVIPAIHLIVDVAQPSPRADGSYLGRMSLERVASWVELARVHGLLLFLDLQVGWTEPVSGVRRLAPFLEEPFVHIAIDPEFATSSKGAAPGKVVGQMTAAQVNEVQRYLADIVREHGLPPKILVVHQFRTSMLIEPERFADFAEVDLSIDMDGVGSNRVKLDGYHRWALSDYSEYPSFKLFLQRDIPRVLTPEEVMGLATPPSYVIYQ